MTQRIYVAGQPLGDASAALLVTHFIIDDKLVREL
jgi:hypothetical protein